MASFSALQVILLDEKRAYEERRDDELKLLGLKLWELPARDEKDKADGLFADLVPGVIAARIAQGRLEQRIALLRHVEALRLYAAAHAGRVPEKLADVGVPVPCDPFTGKPFRYEVRDGVAVVGTSGLRFEVVVQK